MKLYRYNLIEIVWQKGQQSQSAAVRMFYFLNQLEKIPRNARIPAGVASQSCCFPQPLQALQARYRS